MTIDRRQFVRRSSLFAGLVSLPDWLARAFTQDPEQQKQGQETRARQLSAAHRRAVARGKPLLVFVVPAARPARRLRGERFGVLLNHGSDGFLLDLALCEVACATVGEVARQAGDVKIEGEPMMLLIEPPAAADAGRGRVMPIDVEFGAKPVPTVAGYEAYGSRVEEYYLQGNEKMAAAVHAALVRDPGMLADRADRVRATLAEDEHGTLQQYLSQAGPLPGRELLVRAAAVVRMVAKAPRFDGDRERLEKALVAAVKEEFVAQRIPGSKWARSTGCGVDIEGEPQQLGVACGMGFTPEVCQRFLYLFAE